MDNEPAAKNSPAPSQNEESKEASFIRSHFQDFYKSHPPSVPYVSMREFGFGWEKKIDFRHKAFVTVRELSEYFILHVPLFASYSAAFYEYPAARPMPAKKPTKAELIFDLDADPNHEGHNPVFCTYCQQKVRDDTIRLLEEFLLGDMGLSKEEVSVNFSGSKGYHVHVYNEALMQLGASQRGQLVEYAGGVNIDFSRFFHTQSMAIDSRHVEAITGPGSQTHGWGRRILDSALRILSLSEEEYFSSMKAAGYTKKQASAVLSNKAYVVTQLSQGRWSALEKPQLLVDYISKTAGIGRSVQLDRGVTIDMARLIRIPGTLHGDSGLVAIATTDLDSFDPSKDAVAFTQGRESRLIPLDDYEFDFGGEHYSLRKERLADVPLAVAMLLLCKKKGMLL